MKIFTAHFQRAQILRQLPLFQSLNMIELQRIAFKANLVHYRKGEVICKSGQRAEAFHCLVSGRVLGYILDTDGGKSDVEFIRRGKPFGLAALLGNEEYAAVFEAINDSTVLEIEAEDFHAILKSVPRIGVELSQMLSEHIRHSRHSGQSNRNDTIITVYAPLAGEGCSTYAINLARSLHAESGQKVILVSLLGPDELSAPVSTESGATPQWHNVELNLSDLVRQDDLLRSAIFSGVGGIDVLPVRVDKDERKLADYISDFVTILASDYGFVVVDLPNHMDDLIFKALTQSDMVHLLSTDDDENLQRVRDIVYRLEEALKENFNQDKILVMLSGKQTSCYLSFEDINARIDYDIYTQLPPIDAGDLGAAITGRVLQIRFPSENSRYSREIRKLARRIAGVQIGLVLGGGAALGVAHIGVLRVLEENHIPVDVIAGSSMGALIGALYAVGKSPDELEVIAREFENPGNMLKLFDPTLPISGIIRGGLIRRWLKRRGLEEKTFYGTRIPLKIIAYDLTRREELVIQSGSLVEAVRKSIAIPGIIHPVKEGERVIIDGGVLNPLPTNVLADLGIGRIIAVNVLQSPQHVCRGYDEEMARLREVGKIPFVKAPWRYLAFRLHKFLNSLFTPHIPDIIVRTLQASEYEISTGSAECANVVIHPDLSGIQWFELYQVETLIKRGEDAARQQLTQIKKLLEG